MSEEIHDPFAESLTPRPCPAVLVTTASGTELHCTRSAGHKGAHKLVLKWFTGEDFEQVVASLPGPGESAGVFRRGALLRRRASIQDRDLASDA